MRKLIRVMCIDVLFGSECVILSVFFFVVCIFFWVLLSLKRWGYVSFVICMFFLVVLFRVLVLFLMFKILLIIWNIRLSSLLKCFSNLFFVLEILV